MNQTYFQSILIATDFSPAAWKAVHEAVKLGLSKSTQITMIHVYPALRDARLSVTIDPILQSIREKMETICKDVMPNEVNVINKVISGNVNKRLATFINENQFDLVIMGINGNGTDNEIGSHTKRLIESSSVPILVIPNNYQLDE